MNKIAKKIRSVTGFISRDEEKPLILSHEHLFIDLRHQAASSASDLPLDAEAIKQLQDNPYLYRDNLVIDDMENAVNELLELRKDGCNTVVDCTLPEIGRDLRKLRELSQRTGVRIIASTGGYTGDTLPESLTSKSSEEICDMLLADLDDFAGVIGELGTSAEILPNELKILKAGAMAQKASGSPLQIHTFPWSRHTGFDAAKIVIDNGAEPDKIVICHTDMLPDVDYMESILKLGVRVQFDDFGKCFPMRHGGGFGTDRFATDEERCDALCQLIERGYINQLLITNDICLKCMLRPWGGKGYVHVFRGVRQVLQERGLASEEWQTLVIDNPANWLGI